MSVSRPNAAQRLLRSFPPAQAGPRSGSKRQTAHVACTIIAKDHLALARVLARSLARSDPQLLFFVLVLDPLDRYVDPDRQPFEIVQLSDLSIADICSLCMRYTLVELATAVKPRLLECIFERTGCRSLLYFDADILVLNSLDPLYAGLKNRSILLTPHITRSIDDDATPGELTHLRCGLYNLGFIGVSATRTTSRMLAWWQQRLFKSCVIRPEEGFFHDQKWMDLVPLIFPDVGIVTDPGYNVAYWNLQERRVKLAPQPRANGNALRFFHFSGYDPRRPDIVSKYQNRFKMNEIGEARALFATYRELLLQEGYEESAKWPYFYDSFDNGAPVTVFIRDLFDSLGERRHRFKNPFSTERTNSFFAWINAPAEGERSNPPYVTNALHFLWASSASLRARFPDVFDRDRESFLTWTVANVDTRSHPIGLWRQSRQG
jgi:hypothetical protein